MPVRIMMNVGTPGPCRPPPWPPSRSSCGRRTLGLDRDSALVAGSFGERDPAVKAMLTMAIKAFLTQGTYVGICGQGPSDLADRLVDEGIESMSLNPDTVVDTWLRLSARAR